MIGPHIINDAANIELLKRWQPPTVLLLDPNLEYLSKVRDALPNSKIIVRIYIPDNEVSSGILVDPQEYAEYIDNLIWDEYHLVFDKVDYFQVANEVCQHLPELKALVEFELNRMHLADEAGYKCGIFGFSVGNPDLPVWSKELLPALKYANDNGHIVLVHQYSKPPTLWTSDPDWHIHRLEHKVLPIINQLGLNSLQFAVTEYGLDDLLYGNGTPGGWQKFISATEYAKQLTDISDYLYQYSDRVLGYCVFTLGSNNSWQTYDINGEVANKLSQYNYVLPKWRTQKIMSKKMRVIASAGLNVRAQPNASSPIIGRLPYNTIISITEYNADWVKYNAGYVSLSWLTDDLSVLESNAITQYAQKNNIDPYLLQALVNIESGGSGFINGRLLIRTEAHLLIKWEPKLNQFFTVDPNEPYVKHYFNSKLYHGNQNKEWEAFDFARSRNKDVAYRATSYGKYQILGDNYNKLGFNTPEQLFLYLSESEENQDKVFFKYLEVFGLIEPLQNKDFTIIATKYNGPGNVQYYSKLLQDNYNHLVPKGDIEEVEELPVNEDQYKELTDRINALTAKVQTLEVTNGTTIEQLIKGIETQRATINNLTQQIANLTEFTITLSKALTELEVPNTDTPTQINFNYSESLTDFIGTAITVNQGTQWKVKDIFTNQDGSWDVSDKPFSIEQSFRDKYLKPVNDKEYISTGDHSITVVTVDKDGNRLGNIPIEFKSNGNPPIIVNRNTKAGSGYENLILYSGQNMSEEKEGPWTTTVGDASVSGLGLFQNWHISIVIVFERQN